MRLGRNFRRRLSPSGKTLIQKAIAVLRRFGPDAHIYLPGVGMLNGLQAANYIDSAGTQAGAVDQPVGLVLDAAGSLGVELSSVPSQPVANSGTLSAAVTTTIGSTYRVFIPNGFYVNFGPGWTTTGNLGVGAYEYRKADGTNPTFLNSSGSTVTFQPSVREVTGIHAQQPTTSAKPILRRGAVVVSQYSGDLTGWQTTAAATITGGQVDPFGGTTAKLMSGAGKNVYFTALKSGSILAGETVTQLIHCYSATAGTVLVGSPSAGPTSFINVASGWGVYAFTWTAVANDGPSIILSGTLAAITVYRSALFRGTYTAAQIQALGGIPLTTTAPASTALGSQYWQFDGSNDSLSLGGPLFQMGDDMWVVAGARCERATANNIIFDTRDSVALGIAGRITYTATGAVAGNWRDDAGVVANITSTSNLLNSANVVALTKQGNAKKLYVNGIQEGGTSNLVLGSGTLSSSRIGSDATASVFHQGAIYPIASGKGLITEAELLLITKLIGQLSGVQI